MQIEKEAINTHCDRCGAFDGNKKIEECGICVCKTCYTTHSILPGQYRYAVLLWLCAHQRHGKTVGTLPSFWPKSDENIPLTPVEVFAVALRYDLPQLPCEKTCFCGNSSHERERDHTANRQCFFHHLEENFSRWVSLLLRWWHIHNTKQSSLPQEFWPMPDGGAVNSPKQIEHG